MSTYVHAFFNFLCSCVQLRNNFINVNNFLYVLFRYGTPGQVVPSVSPLMSGQASLQQYAGTNSDDVPNNDANLSGLSIKSESLENSGNAPNNIKTECVNIVIAEKEKDYVEENFVDETSPSPDGTLGNGRPESQNVTPDLHNSPHEVQNRTPAMTISQPSVLGRYPQFTCSIRTEAMSMNPSMPSPGFPVRCCCAVHMDDGVMIQCDMRSFWQHMACFGLLSQSDAPSKHICNLCAALDPHLCTNPRLVSQQDPRIIAQSCLFLRALAHLRHETETVTCAKLGQRLVCDISFVSEVFQQLTTLGVLKPPRLARKKDSLTPMVVNHKVLVDKVIPQYFTHNTSKSQKSQHTPKSQAPCNDESQEWFPKSKRVCN